MYEKAKVSLIAVVTFLTGLSLVATNAYAQNQDVYDETAYSADMEKKHQKLHQLYTKAMDEKSPQGKAYKAKMEYLKLAREVLKEMNDRFDKMNVKEGATLSPTETLLSIHLMAMMIDMLASEHQPHKDEWEYVK